MAIPSARGSEPCLTPVPSGKHYRVASPPGEALVTPELAAELGRVLDRFAAESGFTRDRPVSIEFRRGIFGHHQVGRAADIYAVGGAGIARWKAAWDAAHRRAAASADPRERHILLNRQHMTNLGWRLYKALQIHGRWAQPYGYPVQLFGPWTRAEGPWKHIGGRLLYAHRDHIHLAK
jgi:hypothetical protein